MFEDKEKTQPPVEDMFDNLSKEKLESDKEPIEQVSSVSEPAPVTPVVQPIVEEKQLTPKISPSKKKKIVVIVAIVVVAVGMIFFLIDFTQKTGVFGLGQSEDTNKVGDASLKFDTSDDEYFDEDIYENYDDEYLSEDEIMFDENAEVEIESPILVELDTDGDGLLDQEEITLGTNLNKVDTDGDGLDDYREVKDYTTDPLNSDTDNDGYLDGEEVDNGYNPKGDGLLLN